MSAHPRISSASYFSRTKLQLALCATILFSLVGCDAEVPKPVDNSTSEKTEAKENSSENTESATTDTTPASSGVKRIIILTNGNSPFWDACRAGLQDAERELGLKEAGLAAIVEVNDGTTGGQIAKLRQFNSQSDIVAVGLAANVANNVGIADAMRDLQKKGVKVITIDSDVNREKFRDARFAFVGTDNFAGGKDLGSCAKSLLPEGGGFVTFFGFADAQNVIDRVGGFEAGAGDKFKKLDGMSDVTDRSRAAENVRNAIQNFGDELKVLVGIWSYNAPAIATVVKQAGKRDQFKIVTFDAEKLAIEEMVNGMIDAMVVQNPYQMGYQGVRLMKALVEDDKETVKEMFPKHGEPEGDIFDTGLKVVVPNDTKREDWGEFGEKTEFLKLEDFRKWLAEYDLESS